jgi:hypothetical protein
MIVARKTKQANQPSLDACKVRRKIEIHLPIR